MRCYIKAALLGDDYASKRIESMAKKEGNLLLNEIEYQKRKLDLDLITKDKYDEIKEMLENYID